MYFIWLFNILYLILLHGVYPQLPAQFPAPTLHAPFSALPSTFPFAQIRQCSMKLTLPLGTTPAWGYVFRPPSALGSHYIRWRAVTNYELDIRKHLVRVGAEFRS